MGKYVQFKDLHGRRQQVVNEYISEMAELYEGDMTEPLNERHWRTLAGYVERRGFILLKDGEFARLRHRVKKDKFLPRNVKVSWNVVPYEVRDFLCKKYIDRIYIEVCEIGSEIDIYIRGYTREGKIITSLVTEKEIKEFLLEWSI